MVFKLVRTDADAECVPCKIQLPQGSHLIGRGKFLECDDKRVSRKHGELTVTEDCIQMKALHQNPCFYIKKGTTETQILKHNFSIELCHGDRFGLLPNTFWFEVIYCTPSDHKILNREQNIPTAAETIPNTDTVVMRLNETDIDGTEVATEMQDVEENTERVEVKEERNSLEIGTEFGDDEELINFDLNETLTNAEIAESQSVVREAPPSMIQDEPAVDTGDQALAQQPALPAPNSEVPSSPTQQYQLPPPSVQPSPSKRCHSPDDSDMKKVKTEPVGIKQEPVDQNESAPDTVDQNVPAPDSTPGPSRLAAPNPDPAVGSPPPAAPPVGRERCWYGVSCYRKNPSHKAQFAHPSDPDWGSGARAPCPHGRACRKPDPRHWRDHEHPPETQPPPPPPQPDRDHRAPKKRKPTQKRKRVQDEYEDDTASPSPDEDSTVTRKRKKKPMRVEDDSEEDTASPSPDEDLIVSGKRRRKPVKRDTSYVSDVESGNEDPYESDGSDEWVPQSQDLTQSQSQDFSTQDT